MKSILKLCCLICICLFTFTSCDKDDGITEETQITTDTPTSSQAQRTCGSDDHMSTLLKDPKYKAAHEARMIKFKLAATSASSRALCSTPVVLPVAVHFQDVTNPDVACLRALAQSQIEILNNDYHGTNSDISTWINTTSSSFPGLNYGETCLTLCLADKNHPTGSGLNDGDPAVTVNTTTGDFNPSWSGYINIYVRPNTGFLGYSPLGGSGTGDGVVVDASAFGTGNGCGIVSPNSPYNLGRTLTHEIGHYLLLDHIWGGGCGQDDDVSDTPDSAGEYYGCPTVGVSTCNSTDLHMNYMDYTDDACMYMFSAGQSTRMENYVAGALQAVVANASNVCTMNGGGQPTCSDGIQNGNETGIDCGGSCPPCEIISTCNDGIQNGNETGIDCGGNCPPCEVVASCSDGIQNGDETGIDCGGSCPPCEDPPTCDDGIRNGDETGVDCGGSCPPCEDPPTCDDGIQNGDETGIDCGGSCFPCETNSNCETGYDELTIIITPDYFGSEITWELYDDEYYVVAEGGPYRDEDTTPQEESVCLAPGCYVFVIYDAYGDGICCSYGEGYYEIYDADGNVIAESDGQYGFYEEQYICVGESGFKSNGSKSTQPERVSITEDRNNASVNNARVGSRVQVKDLSGNVLEEITITKANQQIQIDKSKYGNQDIKFEIADKKGKKKSM